MIRERPSKFKWSNGISPVMMSQIPSRIIPRFFVSLNLLILFPSFFAFRGMCNQEKLLFSCNFRARTFPRTGIFRKQLPL